MPWSGLSKKAIELTPDEVKKAAEAADTNISRRQEPSAIIKVLEAGGIKPTNFSKEVEESRQDGAGCR